MKNIENHEPEQLERRKSLSSSYAQSSRPLPLQFLNHMAGILQHHGIGVAKLSADLLMEKAVSKMGLSDWGGEDFQGPLRTLVDAINQEGHLDYLGMLISNNSIFNFLCNRLCIQEEIKSNPAIMHEEIRRPLFIVSAGRSGTTMLHNLLCLDPSIRFLRGWEVTAPSLHPKYRANNVDNREKTLSFIIWLLEKFAPEFMVAHEITAEGPEECSNLLIHSFIDQSEFDIKDFFPGYVWLHKPQMASYSYYCKILQLLQSHQTGDHWVLKAPIHLSNLGALLETFPDACIVQTHRDPIKIIPSACSLLAITSQLISGTKLDLNHIGRVVSEHLIRYLDNAMEVRGKCNQAQFLDVQYHEVMRNPHGAVRKVYDYFGYPYGAHMDRRITLWLARNKQHKKGVHKYSADQFGLSIPEIRERTARYVEAYNIPRED